MLRLAGSPAGGFASWMIGVDRVTAVLVDGWHEAAKGSFTMDSYEKVYLPSTRRRWLAVRPRRRPRSEPAEDGPTTILIGPGESGFYPWEPSQGPCRNHVWQGGGTRTRAVAVRGARLLAHESTLKPGGAAPEVASGEPRRRVDGRLVVLLIVIALGARGLLGGSLDPVALRTWTTVFVAIVVQALPFLALGVLVSGAITALVSPAVLERALPRSPLLAVPGAGPGRDGPAGLRVCLGADRRAAVCPRGAAGRGGDVHAGRPGGQPGRAGGDGGRLPRPAPDGPWPVPGLAVDLDGGRAGVVAGRGPPGHRPDDDAPPLNAWRAGRTCGGALALLVSGLFAVNLR
jgi:hypothetical protein